MKRGHCLFNTLFLTAEKGAEPCQGRIIKTFKVYYFYPVIVRYSAFPQTFHTVA
jgi:hypothetical protein